MIANHMKPVLVAAALLSAFVSIADARDRGSERHRPHRVENSRWDRQGDGRWNRPSEFARSRDANGGVVSYVRRFRSFSGSTDAYSVPGHGIYFLRDYWPSEVGSTLVLAPKAKIIDVDGGLRGHAFAADSACAFEAGVCVIRGGN